MKAAQLLVKCLENEGVTHIFGVPGEENLDFLEALAESDIHFVLVRHEQAGGLMAATQGRLTGQAGVCFSTLGPGATNLMTAAAYAQLGAMPLLMITGQKPIRSSKQGAFQILDVVNMMEPVTHSARSIQDATWIPSLVHNAFARAMQPRPGAVHLELPEDISTEHTDARPFAPFQAVASAPTEEALETVYQRLKQAQSPLIMIGAGANRKPICKSLPAFIDALQVPFFTSQMGKGVVDERHPLCLGTAALSSEEIAHEALAHADLILNIGHDVIEKPPFRMENTDVIHIHHEVATFDPLYFPQYTLCGDIALSLQALTQRAEGLNFDNTVFKPHLQSYQERLQQIVSGQPVPANAQDQVPLLDMIQVLRQQMPPAGIVALDNGMYKLWFARYYPAFEPNTLLLDNALASMGAGLPSAIGAKITCPEVPVVAVCGDGGFLMNSQSLETAVRERLDLVVIILNDGTLGMIRWKQDNEHKKDFGLRYGNPDFCLLAQSYGAVGHTVRTTQDFVTHLQQAQTQGGVHVLDVHIDYSQNPDVF